jgi:hypothetical protein
MPLQVTSFFSLASSPKADDLEWNACQRLGGKDAGTGDEFQFRWNAGSASIQLYTSQDNGATFPLKASDATTPYTGNLTGVLCVAQDVTNGAIHFLMFDRSGITNARGYGRATFTTSGGHITGYTWQQTPFALTNHTNAGAEPYGVIYVFGFGAAERIFYAIGLATGTTDLTYYAAESSNVTPSSSASFTGIDGSGSDTLIVNLTDATNSLRTNHLSTVAFAQCGSTQDLTMFCAHKFAGDTLNNTGTGVAAAWYKQCAKGASGWTAPTSTTVGTTIVDDDGTTIPNIMDVWSTNQGAYMMGMSPTGGVSFWYVDSSAVLNAVPGSPLPTAHRGGLGTFGVDSSGRIWAIYTTLGVNDVGPISQMAHFDLTKWNVFNAAYSSDVMAYSGAAWVYGCSGLVIEGSSVSQLHTGTVKVATLVQLGPYITTQPTNQYAAVGGTCTFTVTGSAITGSLSYQWKTYSVVTGTFTNVGTNSSSYTTGTLAASDDGTLLCCDVSDSTGTTTSAMAGIYITGLGDVAKGAPLASVWISGGA